jgi:glycosyltransferase XagB
LSVQGQAHVLPAEPLPVEIGFLAAHGVEPAILAEAARLASAIGEPADACLLRSGLLGEPTFYRALAAELGLPFADGELPIAEHARFPGCPLEGIAPLDRDQGQGAFALAPSAGQIGPLLRRAGGLAPGLIVTTPTRLRTEVMRRKAESIADQAANGLADAVPAHSFRGGLRLPQALALCALPGLVAMAATVPAILQCAAFLACLFFLVAVVLRLAAAFEAPPVSLALKPRFRSERQLPVYTIIVPLYREAAIVGRVTDALLKLAYPWPKLDIKLVLESDDTDTRAAIEAMALPACFEVIVAPEGLPRTKPRALNVALPLARGAFVVVYDAEDVPEPDQLRLAVELFERAEPQVACLQARLVIDNTADARLTRLFTVEYATLFDVINPALCAYRLPVPLGGTSNHFRAEILRELGGWDAYNVTEDADLGIRLALAGYRVEDLPSSTHEEAPRTLKAWMSQRTRWLKGFLQVAVTHSRHPGEALNRLGPFGFGTAVTLTLGTVVAALVYPFLAGLAAIGLLTGSLLRGDGPVEAMLAIFGVILFAAGLAAMIVPAAVAVVRRGWWRLLPTVPLMPFYYALITVAAGRAVVELATAASRWNKTEHGLARTSRAGLPLTTEGALRRRRRARGRY